MSKKSSSSSVRPAHSASLEFNYPDEWRAHVVERSVAVEKDETDDARSGVHVAREGRIVVVTVETDDLVALRAGVSSWIRLVETAEYVVLAGSVLSGSV